MAATSGKGGGPGTVPPRPGSGGNRNVPKRPTGRPTNYQARTGGARPAQRVSARQALQQRRQRNVRVASGGVGLVVIIIAIFLVAKLAGGGASTKTPTVGLVSGEFKLPASIVNQVTGVPVSALVKAAETAAKVDREKTPKGTTVVPPYKIGGTPYTSGGKPALLYLGAEFCPYCAGERWALVMALGKFGTFHNLVGTSSSSTDVNASTPTFSFRGSTYNSKYLSFVPVETENNTGGALDKATAAEDALQARWDVPPYVSAQNAGNGYPIPFVYIDGKYLLTGIQYDASHIAGFNIQDAAPYTTAGNNPTSAGAEGAAGMIVADLCTVTHNQPGSVCNAVPASLKGFNMSSLKSKGSSTVTTTTAGAKPSTTKAPATPTTTRKAGS